MAAEPIKSPFPRNRIMTRATTSLAPEEIPSTNGPAMGFCKKGLKQKTGYGKCPAKQRRRKRRRGSGYPTGYEMPYSPGLPPVRIACISRREREHFHTKADCCQNSQQKQQQQKCQLAAHRSIFHVLSPFILPVFFAFSVLQFSISLPQHSTASQPVMLQICNYRSRCR